MRKHKRKVYVSNWSIYGEGRLIFDLIGKKKILRAQTHFPDLEFDVVDRHTKASIFGKYGSPCDTFRRCHLSIADYKTLNRRKLKDIGIRGVFEILEEIWKKEEPPALPG